MKYSAVAVSTLAAVLLLFSPCYSQPALTSKRNEMFFKALASPTLVKGGEIEPHWLADGKRFWFESRIGDRNIFLIDASTGTKKPFFDEPRLRKSLKEKSGKVDDTEGSIISDFEYLEREDRVHFQYRGRNWLLSLANYSLQETQAPTPKNTDQPRLVRKAYLDGVPPIMESASPDGSQFATEKGFNIAIRRADTNDVNLLTTDGSKDYPWVIDSVLWSPNGKSIGVLRVDNRRVPKYPVVQWLDRDVPVNLVPMTRAGGTIPQFELFIFDIATKKRVPVQPNPAQDWSISPVRWTTDGGEVLFLRRDRENKTEELVAARAETGETRIVLRERSNTFVQMPLLEKPALHIVDGGKKFLWLSERTGWNQLYLYTLEGKLIRPLTNGEFPIMNILAVDETNGWVYFSAHDDSSRPYDTHIYRVSLDGNGFHRLTEAEGQHDFPAYLAVLSKSSPANAKFSPNKDYFLDTHSSLSRRPRVDLRKADGTFVMMIEEADDKALLASNLLPPEPFVAKAADGVTDLHGVIYKPFDFDPNRKYPVLDYIYNGPQTTWVPKVYNAGGGALAQAYAQLGYIVVILDGRGTPERGKKYQDVVYGKFGQNEVPDHVAGLKRAAATRRWMDLSRVGLFGGSFGGYMTVRAMLTSPDFFKVGVATAPVYDLFDVPAFMEAYMGSPKANPKGYEAASCLPLAANLKGKLLIIHGTKDVNAPFSGTIRMTEAFIAAGKNVDLQLLPDDTHIPSAKHQLFYLQLMRGYLEMHLAP